MSGRWVVVRAGHGVSFRLDRRVPFVLLALAGLTCAGLVLSIGVGEYNISPLDVVRAILGMQTGDPQHPFVVNTLRLPRALVALMVGFALGVAGAIMQGITRNPLASPELTGVVAGASLAAVTLIVLVPSASISLLPPAALVGAAVVAAGVYVLAWKGGDSPIRLVLVGVGLTSVLGALTTLMVTFGDINQVSQALVWLTGSVHGRSWEEVRAMLPWLLLLLPAAQLMATRIDLLALGEEVARGLGSRVGLDRAILIALAAALTAASVAVAGAVGFVGLMAPHIARRLVGNGHQGLLPAAGLAGGLVMVLADLVGKTVFAPIEIPVGVVTAAVGSPFLLYLLYRTARYGGKL
ncbi:transport system permease protein [Thermobaculum terrenum ATCC BAA-798]|uniref:Transport system permease protein n=1 Tax=Thermobaculum terrenum (strain ATCC BAA-798 / CCMEE 7001 / YNP1) TaxID=525904 RepID=D1CGP7_THET1|nr:iron ABC transporter permease [Thermobaculum terrenum]ACZ42918.1 transport system permease protein [Thermobaculum terrenum ATCC BAA-798]